MHIDDAGQRTETMIAKGLQIMREAIAEYKPVAIVAAYSSGDDSGVSTHFAMTNGFADFVFNADTMVGLAPPRCHLREVCQKFNWPLEVGQATPEGPPKQMIVRGKKVPFDERVLSSGRWAEGATAYEEQVLNYGFLGPGKKQHARMYITLKERPINRMLKRYAAGAPDGKPKVLIVSGIRGGESSIRAGYQRATAAGSFGDVWVNPFYYQTAVDFAAYRDEFSIQRNPVKAQCGISGECCCGVFGGPQERAAYQVADPAFELYLTDLERRCKENGVPCHWAEDPPREWVAAQKIVKDAKRGQGFLFDADERISLFQPMCVGCNNGRR